MINSTKISGFKRRKYRTSCWMSSFITKGVLNGEQLTDETSLALKIIKNQYCFWNGLEDTTVGPIRQYNHHKNNFIWILYSDHHGTTVCGKYLNEVFMLLILVAAWKIKWHNCFQNIQVYIRFFSECVALHNSKFLKILLLYHLVCYVTWLEAILDDLQTRPSRRTLLCFWNNSLVVQKLQIELIFFAVSNVKIGQEALFFQYTLELNCRWEGEGCGGGGGWGHFAVFGKNYCILIIREYKLEKTSVAYEIDASSLTILLGTPTIKHQKVIKI